MKNMSFGKMMGLFAGFLILMIVAAVVIMKMNSAPKSTGPSVTTKRYAPPTTGGEGGGQRETTVAPNVAVLDDSAKVAPANGNQMMGLPAQGQATQAIATQNGHIATVAGSPNVVAVPVGAATGAVTDANQNQHIANIGASVINLDARVAALENQRANLDGLAASERMKPVRPARKASKPRKKVVVVQLERPLTEMRGYKSMAVVGGRAWVSAPDGSEESVLRGEPVPRARVRSMNPETGVVVTTTDERIDPVR